MKQNQISKSVGRRRGWRSRVEHSFLAAIVDYNHNHGWHNGREREHHEHHYA